MPPRGDGSFAVGAWHPGHPPWSNFLEGAWGHKLTCLHLSALQLALADVGLLSARHGGGGVGREEVNVILAQE